MTRPASSRSSTLVFDFDGTILDTETPVYESWAAAYRFAKVKPVPLEIWLENIGMADGQALDIRGILCDHLGVEVLPDEVEDHRRAVRDEMLHELPLRSGVSTWIHAAAEANVLLAVASSSPREWVRPHLARLGLDGYFPVVSCADPPTPGKPDPAVYLRACADLGVDPADAVAIEDSTHGVSAAVAAGMRCIAAPGPITRTMRFDHATVRTDDLAQLDPADWLTIAS